MHLSPLIRPERSKPNARTWRYQSILLQINGLAAFWRSSHFRLKRATLTWTEHQRGDFTRLEGQGWEGGSTGRNQLFFRHHAATVGGTPQPSERNLDPFLRRSLAEVRGSVKDAPTTRPALGCHQFTRATLSPSAASRGFMTRKKRGGSEAKIIMPGYPVGI